VERTLHRSERREPEVVLESGELRRNSRPIDPISSVLPGLSRQRSRFRLTRYVFDPVSQTNAEMFAAAIRATFAQPRARAGARARR